jgi:hypothetical protein
MCFQWQASDGLSHIGLSAKTPKGSSVDLTRFLSFPLDSRMRNLLAKSTDGVCLAEKNKDMQYQRNCGIYRNARPTMLITFKIADR